MSTDKYLKESTADLIQYINWKDDAGFEESAQQAFIALCYRFRKILTNKCEIIAKGKGLSNSDVIEIVENTFKRFYKYSKSFDPDRNKNIDKGLKFYLFSIAQNECTKLICKRNGIGVSPYTGFEEVITQFPDIENMDLDEVTRNQLIKEKEILELALKRHTWKHQVIYLTYKFHHLDGYKMPRQLLSNLRDMLGLGQGTINAYKKEITDTINDYLEIYGKREK